YQENASRYNDYNIQPLKQTIVDLEKEFCEQLFLKIEDGFRIIGSVRAFNKNNICYNSKLFVHPKYQKKGIGTKLLNEVEKKIDYVLKYQLFTGFKDDKNIYLYNKLGYKIYDEKI